MLVTVSFHGTASAQEGADPFEGDEPGAAAAQASPAEAAPGATAKRSKSARSKRSRSRTSRGKMAGHIVPDEKLRPTPPPRPSGNVHMHVLATDESIKVNIYNPDGSFNVDAVQELSHLMRCKRTATEKEIEPRLLTVLSHVYDKYEGRRIEVVSAYRNQRRTTSYHYRGTASDIRVPGVAPKKLRAFVESLDAGGMGIGLYPRTGFVHVDVRPPPSYRWVDWSTSDPDNPGKRPPRGVRRVKLRS